MANFKIKSKNSAPTLLARPRPLGNGSFVTFSSEDDGFRAYVHQDVLDFIAGVARHAEPDEAIGLLAGRICYDPRNGPYTLVMAADGASKEEVEASPSHVRISATGHASVRRRLEDSHPDREIVGWYHSHPHYPARFSLVDAKEQATWNDPNHIGIVFSGTERKEPFGVYRGPGAILLARALDSSSAPVIEDAAVEETPHFLPKVKESPVVHALPHGARPAVRARKVATVLLWAFALTVIAAVASIIWLHYRVRSLENRRDVSQANRPHEQQPANEPTASASRQAPSTPGASDQPLPDDNAAPDNVRMADKPILRTRANPLVPEAAQTRTASARNGQRSNRVAANSNRRLKKREDNARRISSTPNANTQGGNRSKSPQKPAPAVGSPAPVATPSNPL
ncbi:MAG TPA: Mov34/MPN/PAD-1 family protein [Pyrinomonadaceae bacterium]|jgi:proteasome lid subunit RPN8/RPN11|nr:Mov34/MPN/PAD-1 family protein [Pyrinomonadaceae bacterium]